MSSERSVCGVGEQELDFIKGLRESQAGCWNKDWRVLRIIEDGKRGTLEIDTPAYCLGLDGLGKPVKSFGTYSNCVTETTAGIVNPPDSLGPHFLDIGYMTGPLGKVWDGNDSGAIEVSFPAEGDARGSITYVPGEEGVTIVPSTATPYQSLQTAQDQENPASLVCGWVFVISLGLGFLLTRRRLLPSREK